MTDLLHSVRFKEIPGPPPFSYVECQDIFYGFWLNQYFDRKRSLRQARYYLNLTCTSLHRVCAYINFICLRYVWISAKFPYPHPKADLIRRYTPRSRLASGHLSLLTLPVIGCLKKTQISPNMVMHGCQPYLISGNWATNSHYCFHVTMKAS